MAVKLWGSKTPGNAQDVRDLNLLKNKKKVIKMLVIVVVLFCVAWFPLQMYNVLQVTWPEINEYQHINIIWLCFDWLAMSNSCYNPFIYGIYNVSDKTILGFHSLYSLICFWHISLTGKVQARILQALQMLSQAWLWQTISSVGQWNGKLWRDDAHRLSRQNCVDV